MRNCSGNIFHPIMRRGAQRQGTFLAPGATIAALIAATCFGPAWKDAVFRHHLWAAFFIWMLPVLFIHNRDAGRDAVCSMGAMALSIVAVATQSFMLSAVALAVAAAGWLPFSLLKSAWVASAVSWMPFFLQTESPLLHHGIIMARAGTAIAGIVVFSWGLALLQEPVRLAGHSDL